MDMNWNVIKTTRYKETYVKLQAEETVGAETYLPMVKIPKQCLKPGQGQLEPLFPGYLFARLKSTEQLLLLRRVHAFHSLVCFSGQPAFVEPLVIEDLRRRERGRGYINLHIPKQPLQLHQPVRITEGPFRGQTGSFVRYLDSTQRVCILLSLLKSGGRLELPSHAVAAVDPLPAAKAS